MTRNQLSFFIAVCLLISVSILPVFSSGEDVFILGGKNGWKNVPYRKNITTGNGNFNYQCLTLEDNAHRATGETDLLLTFEGNSVADECGNYSVVESSLFSGDNAARGKKAALFNSLSGGLRMQGQKGTIFGSSGFVGSFSISFWLNPAVVDNGESVLFWKSSRNMSNYSYYQMINAYFSGNKLVWSFDNIFNEHKDGNTTRTVSGKSVLVPNKWSFHQLIWNEENGLLEYYVDGRLEDAVFITSTSHERGMIYSAELGIPASIDICPSYSGWLDDFCISREVESAAQPQLYSAEGGRFESEMLNLGKNGASVTRVAVTESLPEQTCIEYYIRSASSPYNWTESYPEWKKIDESYLNGAVLPESIFGTSFQIAVDLYPDGNGKSAPSVTEIKLFYREVEPPLPPYSVRAEAGDGYVDLFWSPSPGANTYTKAVGFSSIRYMIYYGEKSGEYFCHDAAEGASPINAGEENHFRLTGLKNGKIYYFAITAISGTDETVSGAFSEEVYVRPQKR